MDNVNQITAECFNAIRQLRELDGPIRSPETIHERLGSFIESMREKARDAGCEDVMPRSKFTADLAEILQRGKS